MSKEKEMVPSHEQPEGISPEEQFEAEVRATLEAIKAGRPILKKTSKESGGSPHPYPGRTSDLRVSEEVYTEASKRFKESQSLEQGK